MSLASITRSSVASDTSERSFRLKLGAAGLFAFVVHFGYALSLPAQVAGDSPFYRGVASLVASGKGYIAPYSLLLGTSDPTAQHPPGFVGYLALWDELGVSSIRAQEAVCCLLGALTAVLLGLLGRRLAGRRAGITVAFLAAVYPWFFMMERSVNSEALYFPLIVSVLLLAYRYLDNPRARWAAALGALIGLAALTRTDGLFLLIVLAAPLVWRTRGRRVTNGLACLLATALVLAPWLIRNANDFHKFPVMSFNGGVTALDANCAATYSGNRLGFYSEKCEVGSRCAQLAEAPRSNCQRHEATTYIRHHLARFPIVVVARVERAWELYRPRESLGYGALFWGRPRGFAQFALVVYVLVVASAAGGLFLLRRRQVSTLPLMAMIAQVCLVAALAYGESRFRAAAEPALVVLAGVAIAQLGQGRAEHPIAPQVAAAT